MKTRYPSLTPHEVKALETDNVICAVCGLRDPVKIRACLARFDELSGEPGFPGTPCTLEADV